MALSYANITTATTTTVKSGAGILHKFVFNKPISAGVVTIYDNTAASGTKIGTITETATEGDDKPFFLLYDCRFSTGLTIVTSAADDITVIYQ